jgi:pilus assembly protein CpaB
MSRRTIALVLAVALAALATIALISYIRGLEDKYLSEQEAVDVFVAKQDISPGVSGDTASNQGLLERQTVPAKLRPAGAIASLEQISGKVAAVRIFKGEIIVEPRFVTSGTPVKGVLPIPADKQAVSLQVAVAPGVAGFIQPGDKVSLIVQSTRGLRGQASTTGPLVRYLIQGLDVLAVGNRVVTSTAATPGAAQEQQVQCCLLTFAVNGPQAEQIVFAVHNTELYFTLLPEKAPRVSTGGRTFANLFS